MNSNHFDYFKDSGSFFARELIKGYKAFGWNFQHLI